MDFCTADLCDAHPETQVADPIFRSYGGRPRFCGPAATLKVYEDNSLVRSCLESPGAGRVLVVDGGASMRCALVGDQLGALAVQNGWAGVVVHGCVRDSAALRQMPLGVLALGTHPRKSTKAGKGERDQIVRFAGIQVAPEDWIYADEDGLLVAKAALTSSE